MKWNGVIQSFLFFFADGSVYVRGVVEETLTRVKTKNRKICTCIMK